SISSVNRAPEKTSVPRGVETTPEERSTVLSPDRIEIAAEALEKEAGTVDEHSRRMIDDSIEQANKVLESYHRRIKRSVHEQTNVMIYSVVDTEKDEIIREFPSRKIQDMISKMWELAGLVVDEQA
ncbi:MAG: flagellar protein FlaG, partial [Fibrobacterota bacterium]